MGRLSLLLGIVCLAASAGTVSAAQQGEPDESPADLIRLARQQLDAGRYDEAVGTLSRAQKAVRLSPDAATDAEILVQLGWARSGLGRHREALEANEEALRLCQQAADRRCEATAVTAIAHMHARLGESRAALDAFARALPMWEALGDPEYQASVLNEAGWLHWTTGDTTAAIEHYRAASSVAEAAGDREGQGFALNNLGIAQASLGETDRAIVSYERALALRRAAGNVSGEAQTLANLCNLQWRNGDYQKSLDMCAEAARLARTANDRESEAWASDSMGLSYWSLGDVDRALASHHQALRLREAAGYLPGLAFTLNNIGWVYLTQGRYAEARAHFQRALDANRTVGDPRSEALSLNNLGLLAFSERKYAEAREHLEKALRLRRDGGYRRDEAQTLHNIARTLAAAGEHAAADAHFRAARDGFRLAGDRSSEANTLLAMARHDSERGDLQAARASAEQALAIVESLRSPVASVDLRTSFLAARQEYYDLYIDVLMRLHARAPGEALDATALHASERARARSLLELLIEAHADIRQGVDAALLAREADVRRRLDERERVRMTLANRKHTAEEAARAERDVTALVQEYRDVQARIRATSPRYAALTQPEPLQLQALQQTLDDRSVLLEYRLGEPRSYLWVVTSTTLRSHVLPSRTVIERSARRFYALVGESHQRLARAQTERAAAELGALLLGPVAPALDGRRIVVVADGILQYIPFAALADPAPGRGCDGHQYCPLVVSHEIVSLPSASVLGAIRAEATNRARGRKTLAIFSDPVFDAADARVARPDAARAGRFDRLPFSRHEADAIAALAPPERTFKALDFDASRAALVGTELSDYRFVHFATHGIIDSAHPELSGLVLSLVDRNGQAQNGFLRVPELYNLDLGADLVVLSACRTALGAEIKGEGLVGLTRAFMYAGTPRVIASLWDVRDTATAELMTLLYRGMLHNRLSPAAALRAAQIELWRGRHYDAPFYWAGFVLQGEWRGAE